MAKFMGTGLRTLKVDSHDITATTAARYSGTVRWAEAAHEAGLDGAVWMSHRGNTDRAYLLFGDRVDMADLVADSSYARAFALEPDLAWLTDRCVPLHVDVRWYRGGNRLHCAGSSATSGVRLSKWATP